MKQSSIKNIRRCVAAMLVLCMVAAMVNWEILHGEASSHPHEHTFACYQDYWLACEYADDPDAEAHGHYHTEECWAYDDTYGPVCQMEVGYVHTHNERHDGAGFVCKPVAEVLVCDTPIHIHGPECIVYVPIEKDDAGDSQEPGTEVPDDGDDAIVDPPADDDVVVDEEDSEDGDDTGNIEVDDNESNDVNGDGGNDDVIIDDSVDDNVVPDVEDEDSSTDVGEEEQPVTPQEPEDVVIPEEDNVGKDSSDVDLSAEDDSPMSGTFIDEDGIEYEIRYICGMEQHEEHDASCFKTIYECRWIDSASAASNGISMSGSWNSLGSSGNMSIEDGGMTAKWSSSLSNYFNYSIDFSLSTVANATYAAGQLRVYVPVSLFKLRDGTDVTFGNIQSMLTNDSQFVLEPETVWLNPQQFESGTATIALDDLDVTHGQSISDIDAVSDWDDDTYDRILEVIENGGDIDTSRAEVEMTAEEQAEYEASLAAVEEYEAEQSKGTGFNFFGLFSSRANEEVEYYVFTNSKSSVTGEKKFSLSGFLYSTLWQIVDDTSFDYTIYATGTDTSGTPASGSITLHGEINTSMSSSRISRPTSNDYIKRFYNWESELSRYGLTQEQFEQDTAVVGNAPTYAYVRYQGIVGAWGNKYIEGTLSLTPSSGGEVVGVYASSGILASVSGSAKNGVWVSDPVNIGTRSTCSTTTVSVLVRYKVSDVLSATDSSVIDVSLTYDMDYADVDGVDDLSRYSSTLKLTNTSSVIWRAYNGSKYGGRTYIGTEYEYVNGATREKHDEWTGMLSALSNGADMDTTVYLYGIDRAMMNNGTGEDGYYIFDPEKMERVDLFFDQFYLLGVEQEPVRLGVHDGQADYTISGLTSISVRDGYAIMDDYGDATSPTEAIPDNHKDMVVEIYVQTATNPDEWVLDGTVPLTSVWNGKSANYTIKAEDAIRVDIVYPGAYGYCTMSATVQLSVSGESEYMQSMAQRVCNEGIDNVQFVGWGGIILVNGDHASLGHSSNIDGTTVKQVIAYDNQAWKAWSESLGLREQTDGDYVPYRMYDYIDASGAIMDVGFFTQMVARNAADGSYVTDSAELGIQVVDRIYISNTMSIDTGATDGSDEAPATWALLNTVDTEMVHPFNATEAVFFVLLPENMEFLSVNRSRTGSSYLVRTGSGSYSDTYTTPDSIQFYWSVEDFMGTGRTMVCYGAKDYRNVSENFLTWSGEVVARPVTKDIYAGVQDTYVASLLLQGNEVVDFTGFSVVSASADDGSAMSRIDDSGLDYNLEQVFNGLISRLGVGGGTITPVASDSLSIVGNSLEVTTTGRPAGTELYIMAQNNNPAEGYQESVMIYPTEDYEYRLMFIAAGQRQQVTNLGIVVNIEDDVDGSHLSNAGANEKFNNLNGTLQGIDLSGVPGDKLSSLQVWGNKDWVDLTSYTEDPNGHRGPLLGNSGSDMGDWTRISDYATRTDWSEFKSLYFYFDNAVFGSLDADDVSVMTIKLAMRSPGDKMYDREVLLDTGYQAHCQAVYVDNLFGATETLYTGSGSNIAEVTVSAENATVAEVTILSNPWESFQDASWDGWRASDANWAKTTQVYGEGVYHYRWHIEPSSGGIVTNLIVAGSPFCECGERLQWNLTGFDFVKSSPLMSDPNTWVLVLNEELTTEEMRSLYRSEHFADYMNVISVEWEDFVASYNVDMDEVSLVPYSSDIDLDSVVAFVFDWGDTVFNSADGYTADVYFHGIAQSELHDLEEGTHVKGSIGVTGSTIVFNSRAYGFEDIVEGYDEAHGSFTMSSLTSAIRGARVDSSDEQGYIDPGVDTWRSIAPIVQNNAYYAEWGVTEPSTWTSSIVYVNQRDLVSVVADIPQLDRMCYVFQVLSWYSDSNMLVSIDTDVSKGDKLFGIYHCDVGVAEIELALIQDYWYQGGTLGEYAFGNVILREISADNFGQVVEFDGVEYTLCGVLQALQPEDNYRCEEANFVEGSASRLSVTLDCTGNGTYIGVVENFVYYFDNGCDAGRGSYSSLSIRTNTVSGVTLNKSIVFSDPDDAATDSWLTMNGIQDFDYVLEANFNTGKSAPVTDVVILDDLLTNYTFEPGVGTRGHGVFGNLAYVKAIDTSYWEAQGIPVTIFGFPVDTSAEKVYSGLLEGTSNATLFDSSGYDLSTGLLAEESGWVKLDYVDLSDAEELAKYGEFAFWFGAEEAAGYDGFNEIGSVWFDPDVGVRHPMSIDLDDTEEEVEVPQGIVISMGMRLPESVYDMGDYTLSVTEEEHLRSVLDLIATEGIVALPNTGYVWYTLLGNQYLRSSSVTVETFNGNPTVSKTVYHRDTVGDTVNNTAANLLVAANLTYKESYAYRLTMENIPIGASDVMIFDTVENSSILIANSMWADEQGLKQTANESQFYGTIEGLDMSHYDELGIPYTIFVSDFEVAKTYFIDGHVTSDGTTVGYMGDTYPHAIGGMSPEDIMADTSVWTMLSAEQAKSYKGWANVRSFVVWFGTPEEGSYQNNQYGVNGEGVEPLNGYIDVLMRAELDVMPPYGHTVRALNTAGLHYSWSGQSVTYPVFTNQTQVSLILTDERNFSSTLLKGVRDVFDGGVGSWGSYLYTDYWNYYDYELTYTVTEGSSSVTFMDSIEHIMGEEAAYSTGLSISNVDVLYYAANGALMNGERVGIYSADSSKNGTFLVVFTVTNTSSSVIDLNELVVSLAGHMPSEVGLNNLNPEFDIEKFYPGESIRFGGFAVPCTAAMLNGGFSDVITVSVPSLHLTSQPSESFTLKAEEVEIDGLKAYYDGALLGNYTGTYAFYGQPEAAAEGPVIAFTGWFDTMLRSLRRDTGMLDQDSTKYGVRLVSVGGETVYVDTVLGTWKDIGDGIAYYQDMFGDNTSFDFLGMDYWGFCDDVARIMQPKAFVWPQWDYTGPNPPAPTDVILEFYEVAEPTVTFVDTNDAVITYDLSLLQAVYDGTVSESAIDDVWNMYAIQEFMRLNSGCILYARFLDGDTSITNYTLGNPNSNTSFDKRFFLRCCLDSLTRDTVVGNNLFCEFTLEQYAYKYTDVGGKSHYSKSTTLPSDAVSVSFYDVWTEVPARFAYSNADLTTVALRGSGITSIGERAFCNCSGLTGRLDIPDSVTSIGDFAFYCCTGLTSTLVIPDSVTSIGSNAFYGCYGLTGNLVIPNSVTSIGTWAFSGCSGLTGVVLPNGISTIGNCTFYCCYGLTGDLIIPESVTSIGAQAFISCYSLKNIYVPKSISAIGNSAFSNIYSATTIYYAGTSAQWSAIGGPGASGSGCSVVFNATMPKTTAAVASWALTIDQAAAAAATLSLDDDLPMASSNRGTLSQGGATEDTALVEQSGWHGTLVGIDVSDITSKGLTPIVYVSPHEVDDWAPVVDSWDGFTGDFGTGGEQWWSNDSDPKYQEIYNEVMAMPNKELARLVAELAPKGAPYCSTCADILGHEDPELFYWDGTSATVSGFDIGGALREHLSCHSIPTPSALSEHVHAVLRYDDGTASAELRSGYAWDRDYIAQLAYEQALKGNNPLDELVNMKRSVNDEPTMFAMPDPMPDPGIYDYSYHSLEWYKENAPLGFEYIDWETATEADWAQVRSIMVHVIDLREDAYGFVNPYILDSDGVNELSVILHMQAPSRYDTHRYAYNQYFALEQRSGNNVAGGEIGDVSESNQVALATFADKYLDEFMTYMARYADNSNANVYTSVSFTAYNLFKKDDGNYYFNYSPVLACNGVSLLENASWYDPFQGQNVIDYVAFKGNSGSALYVGEKGYTVTADSVFFTLARIWLRREYDALLVYNNMLDQAGDSMGGQSVLSLDVESANSNRQLGVKWDADSAFGFFLFCVERKIVAAAIDGRSYYIERFGFDSHVTIPVYGTESGHIVCTYEFQDDFAVCGVCYSSVYGSTDATSCPICGEYVVNENGILSCLNTDAHRQAYAEYFNLSAGSEGETSGTMSYSIKKSNITTVALSENPNLPFAGGEGTEFCTIVGSALVASAFFFTAGAWLVLKKKETL